MLIWPLPRSPSFSNILLSPEATGGLSHLVLPPIIDPGLRADSLENASTLSPHFVQPSADLALISRSRGLDALLSNEPGQRSSTNAQLGPLNLSPGIGRNALRLAGVESLRHIDQANPTARAAGHSLHVARPDSSRFSFEGHPRANSRHHYTSEASNELHSSQDWRDPAQGRYLSHLSNQNQKFSPRMLETMSAPSTADPDTSFREQPGTFHAERSLLSTPLPYEYSRASGGYAKPSYPMSPPAVQEQHRPQTSYEGSFSRRWHDVPDMHSTRTNFSPLPYTASSTLSATDVWPEVTAPANPLQYRYNSQIPQPIQPSITGELAPTSSGIPLTELETRCAEVGLICG